MVHEYLNDEWLEWVNLTPLERFRRSSINYQNYLALGGSLAPDPGEWPPAELLTEEAQASCYTAARKRFHVVENPSAYEDHPS